MPWEVGLAREKTRNQLFPQVNLIYSAMTCFGGEAVTIAGSIGGVVRIVQCYAEPICERAGTL